MQKKFSRILIGNVLKSIRTEKKIPIKKVAQNMDVSEATISQFETGKNKPTNEKIALFTELCWQSRYCPYLRALWKQLFLMKLILALVVKWLKVLEQR